VLRSDFKKDGHLPGFPKITPWWSPWEAQGLLVVVVGYL